MEMEESIIESGVKKSTSVAITGGSGYLGYHIGVSLFRKGFSVTLLDLMEPHPDYYLDLEEGAQDHHHHIPLSPNKPTKKANNNNKPMLTLMKVNIASEREVERAFALIQPDCVIHCASFGMSGKEQMPSAWDKTEEINIGGTKNIINACGSVGVSSLVYTSSFNVVFGGQKIIDGDESLPYFPLHRHVDHYSRTKSVAEQLVLMADGKISNPNNKNKNDDGAVILRTCALRLAGLMGVKEKRHLPRIVEMLPMMKFTYGYDNGGYVQFVSLANAVQAHVKACEGLLSSPEVVGGQAYFISDGEPISNFWYFKPLLEKLGYSYPKLKIPMWIIWTVTYLIQIAYLVVVRINPKWAFTPFLTPAEVYKTGMTHYFSSEKAKKHLGYCPERPNEVIFDVAEYYYQKKITERNKKSGNDGSNSNSNVTSDKIKSYRNKILLVVCLLSLFYFILFCD